MGDVVSPESRDVGWASGRHREHRLVADVAGGEQIHDDSVLRLVEVVDDGLHGVALEARPLLPVGDVDRTGRLAAVRDLLHAPYANENGERATGEYERLQVHFGGSLRSRYWGVRVLGYWL